MRQEKKAGRMHKCAIEILGTSQMVPPSNWTWHAIVNDPVKPQFITLYAFKQGLEPEVYFMWMTDHEHILYWLQYLYMFDEVKRHVLNAIYADSYPDNLFKRAIKKLNDIRECRYVYDAGKEY